MDCVFFRDGDLVESVDLGRGAWREFKCDGVCGFFRWRYLFGG